MKEKIENQESIPKEEKPAEQTKDTANKLDSEKDQDSNLMDTSNPNSNNQKKQLGVRKIMNSIITCLKKLFCCRDIDSKLKIKGDIKTEEEKKKEVENFEKNNDQNPKNILFIKFNDVWTLYGYDDKENIKKELKINTEPSIDTKKAEIINDDSELINELGRKEQERYKDKIYKLGRAKLSKSKEDITKHIDAVNKSSEDNRNFFIVFLSVLFIVLVKVLSTSDKMLLLKSDIKFPILDMELNIIHFYLVAPIVIFALHFNLIYNLNKHFDKLRGIEDEINQQNKNLISTFILNSVIIDNRSNLGTFLIRFIFSAFVVFLPVALLGLIQMKFSKFQNINITNWYHYIILILDIFMSLFFMIKTRKMIDEYNPECKEPDRIDKVLNSYLFHWFGGLFPIIVFVILYYFPRFSPIFETRSPDACGSLGWFYAILFISNLFVSYNYFKKRPKNKFIIFFKSLGKLSIFVGALYLIFFFAHINRSILRDVFDLEHEKEEMTDITRLNVDNNKKGPNKDSKKEQLKREAIESEKSAFCKLINYEKSLKNFTQIKKLCEQFIEYDAIIPDYLFSFVPRIVVKNDKELFILKDGVINYPISILGLKNKKPEPKKEVSSDKSKESSEKKEDEISTKTAKNIKNEKQDTKSKKTESQKVTSSNKSPKENSEKNEDEISIETIKSLKDSYEEVASQNIILRKRNLRFMNLINSIVYNVDFTEADLIGTNFKDSTLNSSIFKEIKNYEGIYMDNTKVCNSELDDDISVVFIDMIFNPIRLNSNSKISFSKEKINKYTDGLSYFKDKPRIVNSVQSSISNYVSNSKELQDSLLQCLDENEQQNFKRIGEQCKKINDTEINQEICKSIISSGNDLNQIKDNIKFTPLLIMKNDFQSDKCKSIKEEINVFLEYKINTKDKYSCEK